MSVLNSIRRSVRALARRPGFTAIVVVTLTLGIGANTAVFRFVNPSDVDDFHSI